MAIGTPYALGSNHGSISGLTGGTQVVTAVSSTSNAVASTDGIIGWLSLTGTSGIATVTSATDTAGNSYTIGTTVTSGSFSLIPIYRMNATALGAGSSISVTFTWVFGTYNTAYEFVFMGCSGLSAIDLTGSGASGTSTAPSISIGAGSTAAELLFPALATASSATTKTEASGFTAGTLDHNATQGTSLFSGYKVVSSIGAVTYNPTISGSVAWTVNYVTFTGAAIPPPPITGGAFFQFMRGR